MNKSEQEAFYNPPVFNSNERKQFFDFPASLLEMAVRLQKPARMKDPEQREKLLSAIASHSIICWEHMNMLGEYDFSDNKLKDSVGIVLPKRAA